MDIDIKAERDRLISIWKDTLELCQTMVKDAKAGRLKLKASLLKEINNQLRISADILDRLEERAKQAELEKLRGTSTESPDAGEDADFDVPFPVQSKPLKIN